jgi:hypothetical protein
VSVVVDTVVVILLFYKYKKIFKISANLTYMHSGQRCSGGTKRWGLRSNCGGSELGNCFVEKKPPPDLNCKRVSIRLMYQTSWRGQTLVGWKMHTCDQREKVYIGNMME